MSRYKEDYDRELEATKKRIEKYIKEFEDIQDAMIFKYDAYAREINKNDVWLNRALDAPKNLTEEEETAIMELYAAKEVLIEQEKEDKISAIRKAADAEFKTDLQNRLDKIDEEKEKWISAGMSKAEANILAERKKTQEISKLNSEITSEINSLYQSALENRLEQIEKEKEAYIQKGVDEVKAAEWAEEKKAKAAQEAAKNILKQQAKEYDIYQKEGYGGLQAYKRGQLMNDLAKAGINPNYLYMTPEQARDFQSANETAEKSLMPNMMSQKDREENVKRLENWYNSRNLSKGEHILDTKESGNNRETLTYNPYDYYRNEMQQSGGVPKDYKSPITSANNAMLAQLADEMKKVGAKKADVLLGSDGKPIGYAYAHGEPEKESEQPQNLIDTTAIDEFTDQMHNATENFNAMNDAIRNVSYSPEQANQQFANSYSSIPSGVQYASGTPSIPSAYSDQYLTPIEQPTIQQTEMPMLDAGLFGDLSEQTVILTQNFSKLGEVIANITLSPDKQQPQHYSDLGSSQQQTPQPINNNIQINEAHAWDSEHIQELAEKVADVIRPALEQALGGNSNAY